MSLYKRGTFWHVDFKASDGRRIRRSTGTEDKQQAQEYLDRLRAEQWRIKKLGEKPRRTWQEAVVRWLRDMAHKADYQKDIAKLRWLDRYLGGCYLDEINRDRIDAIADTKKREASASTANRYKALIRAILNMAKDDWEWIERVPKIRMYPEPKKRVRFLTQEEAVRLIAELPPHLASMARFSLATGLRQRNVSYLKWEQVDLGKAMAWIHADQSKSRRAIAVPLNATALQVLHEQQGHHAVYVFTYQGKPVDRTSTKAWKAACKRAGITDFRWHDLRHTWATWHVQNGTSLHELMELGGWSCYEMVLRYAHFAGGHLRKAAHNIDDTNLSHHKNRNLRLVVSR